MTTSQMIQEIRNELAGSADDLALQNGEITHAEHAHREQVRRIEQFWNSGQVGTN